jgi:hypothetical protein
VPFSVRCNRCGVVVVAVVERIAEREAEMLRKHLRNVFAHRCDGCKRARPAGALLARGSATPSRSLPFSPCAASAAGTQAAVVYAAGRLSSPRSHSTTVQAAPALRVLAHGQPEEHPVAPGSPSMPHRAFRRVSIVSFKPMLTNSR